MIDIGETRAFLESLTRHADLRHRPRRLCARVDAALSSSEALAEYLRRDGTFDGDLLVLPRPPFISMAGVMDETGRPLREGLAIPALLKGVPMELRACPYAGSRQGKPMNVTAFKIIGESWREFLFTLDAMRALYCRRFAVDDANYTVVDAHRVSQLLVMLPFASTYRARDPIGTGRHSAMTSSVFRVALGTSVALAPLVFERVWLTAQGDEPPRVDAKLITERAELGERSQLEGVKEVCTGPTPMIEETIAVLLHGLRTPIDDEAFAARFARVVGDEESFLGYATSRLDLEMLSRAPLAMHRRMIAGDVIDALAAAPDTTRAAARALDEDLPTNDYGDAGRALADDERAVLLEHLMTPMFSPRDGMFDCWRADRALARAQVASLLTDINDPDARERIADRFVVMALSESALASYVIEAEHKALAACGRQPGASPGTGEGTGEHLAEALHGMRLPAFFEDALGLKRSITGDEIRVMRGSTSVVLTHSGAGRR